jgi:hypothetical protein
MVGKNVGLLYWIWTQIRYINLAFNTSAELIEANGIEWEQEQILSCLFATMMVIIKL